MQKFLGFAAIATIAGAAIAAFVKRDDLRAFGEKMKAGSTGRLDELAPAPEPVGGH